MKTVSIVFLVLFSFTSYAQVGIGTASPQGELHVDGQRDNPTIGTPNPAQEKNDFIVTAEGKVGVGLTSPVAKLEVKGYIKVGTQLDEVATVPVLGMIRFNTTNITFEGYVPDAGSGNPGWVALH
jgi:hypothetical protein